jgi:hypothetical protein
VRNLIATAASLALLCGRVTIGVRAVPAQSGLQLGVFRNATHCNRNHLVPLRSRGVTAILPLVLPEPIGRTAHGHNQSERDRLIYQPVADRLNRSLQTMGVGPLSMTLFDSVVELADAYLQVTVPSFEFPRDIPPSVHFVGAPRRARPEDD